MTKKYKEKKKKKSRREEKIEMKGKGNSMESREETEGKFICLQYCIIL